MANGVEVARAFVTIVPTAKGAQAAITNAIVPAAATAGKSAGAAAGAPMLSGITGALSKFVAPAAIIGGLTLIGKKGAEAFQEVEAGANNVIKATGATGDAADDLIKSYKNVARNVVGDFDDIGSAVGEINTRLGLTGKDLEGASEAMMKYAKVTGQDATKATQDVVSMMRNAGIPTKELGDTLGKLTVAGQAAGIDVSNLAKNTTKYNAVMKQLGLSTDEQIALMAKFEVSGADTASILNAMKKGVASWAKEGKDARVEFENFAKGVQDGTVTAGDAVEIFGSKGGLSMYEAAQKGQLSFEDMYEAIEGASQASLDQVYNDTLTASEKIDLAWQNISLATAEIFAPIMEGVSNVLDNYIVPFAQMVSDSFVNADSVIEGFGNLTENALGMFGNFVASIIEGIPGAIDSFASMVDGFLDSLANGEQPLQKGGESMFSKIGAAVEKAWPKIKTALGNALKKIGQSILDNGPTILKNAANALGKMAQGVAKAVPGILRSVGELLLKIVRKIPEVAGQLITKGAELIGKIGAGIQKEGPKIAQKVGEFVGKIPAKIAEFFSRILQKGGEIISNIVKGITGAKPTILDKIGEAIKNTIAAIPGFIGGFVKGGADLIGGVISGITGKKSEVQTATGDVVSSANTKAASYTGQFKTTGSNLGTNLGKGLGGTAKTASDNASTVANKANSAANIGKAFSNTGTSLGQSFAGGLGSRTSKNAATSNASSVSGAAVNHLDQYNQAYNQGTYFGKGFANGIRAQYTQIRNAGASAGTIAKNALASAIRSASPSKETAKIGGWFSQGFAIGIEHDERLAEAAAHQLGRATMGALDATAQWSGDTLTGPHVVGVTITGNEFNVRTEDDIAKIGRELNQLINREMVGTL